MVGLPSRLPVVTVLTGGSTDTAASALTLEDCPDIDHRETIGLMVIQSITEPQPNYDSDEDDDDTVSLEKITRRWISEKIHRGSGSWSPYCLTGLQGFPYKTRADILKDSTLFNISHLVLKSFKKQAKKI
ncbi:hypothetical protein CHARACLAT_022463 [Characodon lateralis]|uniref:Uncharacterized protein n=1 Tax=Characodon lateralis TaxID=208331 RepID=A0ABU7E2L2_9TELE|nr:hypothetical protein [Characodon lateralis]